jgi:hypothetical protein
MHTRHLAEAERGRIRIAEQQRRIAIRTGRETLAPHAPLACFARLS